MDMNENGFINLSNNLAECKISPWGANIVSYRPGKERQDIFWLGEFNKFDPDPRNPWRYPGLLAAFCGRSPEQSFSAPWFCKTLKLGFKKRFC